MAIVVIDNFSAEPGIPQKVPGERNCAYTPEDTNVVGDSGAADNLPAGVSHGAAVQSRLSAELGDMAERLPTTNDLAPYGLAGMPGISDQAERFRHGGHELTLIGMQTNGFTTAQLTERIAELNWALRTSPRGITRLVLNMSFVLAPCNVPAWLDEIRLFDGARTLRAYEALIDLHPELERLRTELDLLAVDPIARDARLLSPLANDPLTPLRTKLALGEFYGLAGPYGPLPALVQQRLNSDPLRALLTGLADSSSVVPVAAAGNGVQVLDGTLLVRTRFLFPFAPALWNPVVSVSGLPDAVTGVAYSNNGEVVMEGDTYVRRLDGTDARVLGSSFAAPRLSARVAVYLLAGGPSPCNGHVPVLGYTNSDFTGQYWADLEVAEAASMFCPALIN